MSRFLFVSTFVVACSALIEDLSIKNDDRKNFHIESFGFEEGGRFEANLKEFALMVPHDFQMPADDTFNIAFVLQRSNSDVGVKTDSSKCFHEVFVSQTDLIVPLKHRTNWENLKFSKTISEPGYYHLYFSNCVDGSHSSFELVTTQYNFDSTGNKVYLSTGLSHLPAGYFTFTAGFIGMCAGWIYMQRRQWKNVRSIHHVMTVVVVFEILSVFCEAFQYHTMKVDGVHDGWSAAFYVFYSIKGMLMFTAIVLIGTGWSYLKPFLTERDKQLILAVLVVQGMVNVAIIAVDESTPGSYSGMRWRDILHVFDMICCCAILFPIVWSIRHLRAASGSDSKAARNMDRLRNFRTFYLLVVAYIYFTRIILFLLEALLPFHLTYLGPVFNEVASVVFYGVTGWLFRPQEINPYLAINKDDDDADMQEVKAFTEL
jgi:hypothetical protein